MEWRGRSTRVRFTHLFEISNNRMRIFGFLAKTVEFLVIAFLDKAAVLCSLRRRERAKTFTQRKRKGDGKEDVLQA
jgi:hypothetical protein